ncbi:MAG: hypothetical protein GC179_17270 [Anaerolineaceae bacterium]|nr:hypothetical protein [Anaerolineaceae bacterium]
MNTSSSQPLGNNIVVVILGILAVVLVYSVVTGNNVTMPVISTDRAALIALLVLGIAMCSVGGIGSSISQYGWSHPVTIIGSILGVLTLLIVLAVLLGIQLPLITSERAAFLFVTGIIVTKVVFNAAVWLFNRGNVA